MDLVLSWVLPCQGLVVGKSQRDYLRTDDVENLLEMEVNTNSDVLKDPSRARTAEDCDNQTLAHSRIAMQIIVGSRSFGRWCRRAVSTPLPENAS